MHLLFFGKQVRCMHQFSQYNSGYLILIHCYFFLQVHLHSPCFFSLIMKDHGGKKKPFYLLKVSFNARL